MFAFRLLNPQCHTDCLVSAETFKACALIGLHLLEADNEDGSSGSLSLDLGDMCKYGCGGESGSDFRAHNVKSLGLHVIGLNWSGEKISLFLEDWELGRVALSCHIALETLCQARHEGW